MLPQTILLIFILALWYFWTKDTPRTSMLGVDYNIVLSYLSPDLRKEVPEITGLHYRMFEYTLIFQTYFSSLIFVFLF